MRMDVIESSKIDWQGILIDCEKETRTKKNGDFWKALTQNKCIKLQTKKEAMH